MISNDEVAEIFFLIDEFCKVFESAYNTQRLIDDSKKQQKRAFEM